MLSKDFKQLIDLSGGKMVLSEGNLEDSYVVMKLGTYLQEKKGRRELPPVKFDEADEEDAMMEEMLDEEFGEEDEEREVFERQNLTDQELLDKINADIDELRKRQAEKDTEEFFQGEEEKIDYDYV